MTDPKNTLDKIQEEIRENIQRENELKNGHYKLSNRFYQSGSSNSEQEEVRDQNLTNGVQVNGAPVNGAPSSSIKSNGFIRRFTPNAPTKGIMHKFFKNRGKVNVPSVNPNENNNVWINDDTLALTNFHVDQDKPLRNGYVPAEEKIIREINDFRQREAELRKLRRQSQPDLMAALDLDDDPKPVSSFNDKKIEKLRRSMTNLYQPDRDQKDLFEGQKDRST